MGIFDNDFIKKAKLSNKEKDNRIEEEKRIKINDDLDKTNKERELYDFAKLALKEFKQKAKEVNLDHHPAGGAFGKNVYYLYFVDNNSDRGNGLSRIPSRIWNKDINLYARAISHQFDSKDEITDMLKRALMGEPITVSKRYDR